ncbi:carboxymuconolactone decarboxylase family protein [Gordonia sp. LSe1-13]|uniref:Carboxymuconolactone decarboxylase family protein n=1 Tax=Gordonia sesuvii TaxID=3116777 RepID=A0ABU7M9E3_9ACTN|nr:carboxymuconolactone decarboxylase family protein [Gordonia sp. LSe1-13]
MSSDGRIDAAHRVLYDEGLVVRTDVVGQQYVAESTARAAGSDGAALQQFVTEMVWGSVWTRPGLDRRSRSLMTIGVLVALNHHAELAVHVRGGLRNGLTRDEISEAVIHATAYCGVPAGVAAMRVVQDVLADELGPRSTADADEERRR